MRGKDKHGTGLRMKAGAACACNAGGTTNAWDIGKIHGIEVGGIVCDHGGGMNLPILQE
jgi:hypothetical protein